MGEKHLGRPGVCFLSTCSPARRVAWAFVAKNHSLPDSASLWRRDLKVSANLEREDFVDLAVTWHRRCFACRTVVVQRTVPATRLHAAARSHAENRGEAGRLSSSLGDDQGLADDILALK